MCRRVVFLPALFRGQQCSTGGGQQRLQLFGAEYQSSKQPPDFCALAWELGGLLNECQGLPVLLCVL